MRPLPRKRGAPRVLWFARQRKPVLAKRFTAEMARLSKAGGKAALLDFMAQLDEGYPAINMRCGTLAHFLETGKYLNTYEVAESETLRTKKPIHEILKRILGDWYAPRLNVDRILGMRFDTHYAYKNMGSRGPTEYGPCSVVLSKRLLRLQATAFSGDSVCSIFDKDARQLLTKSEALALLATADCSTKLAALEHSRFIETSKHGISVRDLHGRFDARDTLLELHIHGPIRRGDIIRIMMSESDLKRLFDLLEEISIRNLRPPWSRKYDEAAAFGRMYSRAQEHSIPVRPI